jgi:hypothetical protein
VTQDIAQDICRGELHGFVRKPLVWREGLALTEQSSGQRFHDQQTNLMLHG